MGYALKHNGSISRPRLLLVEDDSQIARAVIPGLEFSGHDVKLATTGSEAVELLGACDWDAVVLDLGLPDMDGKDLITQIRSSGGPPVVVISARPSEEEKRASLERGARHFLRKPFRLADLISLIESVLSSPPKTD